MTTLDLCSIRNSAEYELVVLGGGLAGGHFISEYIEKGGSGRDLCLVTSEAVYPYERPFLSKGFFERDEKITEHHTGGHDQEWYHKNKITVLLNVQCTKVDIEGKSIIYQGKKGLVTSVSWRSGLIIATGSRQEPFNVPGIHAKGCHKLQCYNDALAMKQSLSNHRGGTIIIFGDQCPSMDVATILRLTWGMTVYFLLPTNRLFPSLFDDVISEVYEKKFSQIGIEVIKEAVLKQVLFDKDTGAVTGIKLEDGTVLECDVLIYESERVPNVGLVSKQLVLHPTYKGIVVNENMKTSAEGVFAIGEAAVLCVECEDTEISQKLQCVSSQFSMMMGKHLAKYLSGMQIPKKYMYFPEFNAAIAEMKWRFFGVVTPECVVKHKLIHPYFITVWLRNDKLQAAFLESGGDAQLESLVRQATKNQITLTAEEIDNCPCIEHLITKVFTVRTHQRLAARNQAIVAIPTLQFQIEQAMLQIQRTQQQVVHLKTELVQALDDRKRILWYSDQDVKESLLHVSCDTTGCGSGLDPPEYNDESAMPSTQSKLGICLFTLLNTFAFVSTQFVYFRELYVMHPFPYFTVHVNAIITLVIAGTAQLVLESATKHPQLHRSALQRPPTMTIVMLGALFNITNVLQVAAIDALGPPNANVVTLLGQFSVPFTAIACYFIFKTRYGLLQMIGLALAISGVAMLVGRGPSCDELPTGKYIAWVLAYTGSCVVQAGLDILTQRLISTRTEPVTVMDVLHLLVLMNAVSIITAPIVSGLFGAVATTDIGCIINHDYGDGAVCLLTGNTSSSLDGDGDTHWWYTSQCEHAPIWVVGYCICNIVYVVVSTLVVMVASQKCQFLAQLLSLPILNAVLSSDALMAGHIGTTDSLLWLSIAMVFLGMTLHEHELLGFQFERHEEEEYLLRQSPASSPVGSSPAAFGSAGILHDAAIN